MSARRLTVIVAVTLTAAISVGTAAAAAGGTAVPGAAYAGTAPGGAQVTFTISPDGTLVTSYQILGASGGGCQFTAEGNNGVWQGAPIVNNSFQYQLGTAISIQGTFPGPQSMSGTFDLHQSASSQTNACDTGTVSWTATTTASPVSSGSGSGSGGAGGNGHKPGFWTRVSFRRASSALLRGQVKSPGSGCRAGRTVYLWRGARRIASTKSKAGGKFSFAVTARVRGRQVRASAAARSVRAGACTAGSSVFIKG